MSSPDLADVQGTILRGYRVDYGRHFVLRVKDAAAARAFLGSTVDGTAGVPQITTAARWTRKPLSFLNLGITFAGLRALGVPDDSLASFPASFRAGATDPGTAGKVGDTGESAPANWIGGLSEGDSVHAILSLWACDSLEVLEEVSALLRHAFEAGWSETSCHDATALPDNRVHFGYRDSIAQPTIECAPPRKRPFPDDQPVAPTGEFLMGYPSQNPGQTYSVQPEALSTNSSFAAFRILEQDVAGFEAFLAAYAPKAGLSTEMLAAKVCGRWRSGLPLTLSPDTDQPSPPVPLDQYNNFSYEDADERNDANGYGCPVGSHIRRSNPRSQPTVLNGGHLHRIVRRAMPYGPAYDPEKPVEAPRGLVGYFINVDLANQFEFLMSQWVNASGFVAFPGPVNNISGQDVLLGANTPASGSSFTLSAQGKPNQKLTGFGRFVTTRGGAYCYLPSVTAIRHLASLTPG